MTSWKTINTAAKDGTPVLLWARLKNGPPENPAFYPIVGFWHRLIEKWKVAPEHLNQEEELIASHWAALPEPPKV